jgi:hypothetical protein
MKMLNRLGSDILKNIQVVLNWFAGLPAITFLFIFILSFAVRLQALMKIPSRYLVPNANWELGSIAISLMETGQFADPYMIPTGPTAHLPPVYPAIISLIYRTFGLTTAAGYASMLFMILNASLLYATLPWSSKKLGMSSQAGVIAGLAGALFVEWGGHGEYLTAIVLGLLLVAFFQRWARGKSSFIGSLLLGLAIGASFHLQSALLPVIIGCMLFELWWSKNRKKWMLSLIMTFGILLTCIPWGWRNYTTFNAIFFIRSNLGLELRMGNHEGAYPAMEVMDQNEEEHLHPASHFSEARKLKEIGEIAYMRGAMDDALEWISANPSEFLRLTGLRVLHIWFGPLHDPKAATQTSVLTLLAFLGVWFAWKKLSIPQRAILLIPLATFPLIYYLVAYTPRYRVPIDWILFMLAGSTIWYWIGRNIKENEYV